MQIRRWMALLALAACQPAPEEPLASLPVEIDVALPPARATMDGVANRSGSALARLPDESALILADEDHGVVRRIPLPVDVRSTVDVAAMPGAPAQVVALADRVLVTIREPGMLLELDHALRERARVDLPSDAWGIAVSSDGRTAVVTSAWTHRATGIDLATMTTRWSLVMAREPRGVAIAEDGTTYVSHLVGSRITKISGIHGSSPTSQRIEAMPSPLRSPAGRLLHASLGYTAVLSPDGKRLFLPRHALGAQGSAWWFGQPTVDVLLTADETSLAPRNVNLGTFTDFATGDLMDVQGTPPIEEPDFVQPRDAIYRKSTNTLLVASEGSNVLAELDARALDPSIATRRVYRLATYEGAEYPYPNIVVSGGAPAAIALSADEKMAWVFCRSTYDIAIVELDQEEDDQFPYVHLADDPLGDEGAKGRRLFYDATDGTISGGLGCAGCHPEGRDDGHVWHEIFDVEAFSGYRGTAVVANGPPGSNLVARGVPRQTPMLAGRVRAFGPYGWRGESPSLEARIRAGFSLHRWQGSRESSWMVTMDRSQVLAAFIRKGLVAPLAPERELTAQEKRGKELFAHADVGCASCHVPATEFTDRIPLPLRTANKGFDPEPGVGFKTPSLLFVGGTPPYYHDGAARSLEELVRTNGRTMGDTARLSAADQQALAAYLRTIGGYVEPFPEESPPTLPKFPPNRSGRVGSPPARSAWGGAEPLATNEQGCTVRQIDTWVRVDCPSDHGLAMIAGGLVGLERWSAPPPDEFSTGAPALVFPLHQGDRRVVQLTTQEALGRWGSRTVSAGILSAHWLEGEHAPTLVLE